MKRLPFLEAVALLVGTIVGAGFLSIPYVVAKVGLISGLVLILALGMLVMVQFLSLTEITLRTKSQHQIAGYVVKYLGSRWRIAIDYLVIFGTYGGLLAYVIGEGKVWSAMLGGPEILYSLAFIIIMAVIVFHDLKLIEKVDFFLTLTMVLVVVLIAFLSWSKIQWANFSQTNFNELLPAYGIILFSLLGSAAIPEMRQALKGKERLLPKAVIIGTLIPIVIYLVFTLAVLGVTGSATTEVSTIGLGQKLGSAVGIVGNLLAVITMTTAFLGLSLSLKETFIYDLKISKIAAWALTLGVPAVLFLAGLKNFISILLVIGALFGGVEGIILVLTARKAKILGDRKPEYVLPFQAILGTVLVAVFSVGIFYTLRDFLT